MYIHAYIQVELRCDRNIHVGKSLPQVILFSQNKEHAAAGEGNCVSTIQWPM